MGLFNGLAKVFGGQVVGTILGAKSSKKAIGRANDATQLGISNAKGDLNNQLATTTANFAPYTGAGADAIGQERDILGLNGAASQGSVIDQLKASPYFQSLFRTGQETILGNASATGGLRGGNVQSSLANFGSDTLAQTIQQQLANLSPLVQTGYGATSNLGTLGAANSNTLASLDFGGGVSNANAITGKAAVDNKMYQQLQAIFQSAATGGAGGAPIGAAAGGSGGAGGFDLSAVLSSILKSGGSNGGIGAGAPNIPISLPSGMRGPPF